MDTSLISVIMGSAKQTSSLTLQQVWLDLVSPEAPPTRACTGSSYPAAS